MHYPHRIVNTLGIASSILFSSICFSQETAVYSFDDTAYPMNNSTTTDFNLDGKADVFADHHGRLLLFTGTEDNVFSEQVVYQDPNYPGNPSPDAISHFDLKHVIDTNNDGHRDILASQYITDSYYLVSLEYNPANNEFDKKVFPNSDLGYQALVDYDKDEKMDMLSLNGDWQTGTSELIMWRQSGNEDNGLPSFTKEVLASFNFEAYRIEFTDLNNDQLIDIVFELNDDTKTPSGGHLVQYAWVENLGNNSFSEAKVIVEDINSNGQTPYQIADLNNDGLKDLIYYNKLDKYCSQDCAPFDLGKLGIAYQQSDESFINKVIYQADNLDYLGEGIAPLIADINKDGLPDLVVSNSDWSSFSEHFWLRNNGDETFLDKNVFADTGTLVTSIKLFAADIDSDGMLEVLSQQEESDLNGTHIFRGLKWYDFGLSEPAAPNSDSDNDGISDHLEQGDYNQDGIPDDQQLDPGIDSAIAGGAFAPWSLVLIALSLLFTSTLTRANQSVYAGVNLGATKLSPSTSNSGWKQDGEFHDSQQWILGYRPNEHSFIELSQSNLGKARFKNRNPNITTEATLSYNMPMISGGVYMLDTQSQWNIFVKAGVAKLSSEASSLLNNNQKNDYLMSTGTGIEWGFSDSQWNGRIGIEYTSQDVQTLYLGFIHPFNLGE